MNSLYPYVMLNFSFPVGKLYNEKNLNKEGFSYAIVEVPYMYIPYLATKWNGKLIFPFGSFTGFYTNFELREAVKRGYKVNLVDGWVCDETESIFENYVKSFYNLRLEAKKSNNKPLDIFAKLMLNSLYGKFGQNPFRQNYLCKRLENVREGEEVVFVFGGEIKYAIVRKEVFCNQIYFDYVIASYITAYGRHVLYSYIEKVKENELFYTDTDSLFSSGDLDNYIGSDIGLLKKEYEDVEYKAFLPKVYILKTKDKTIVKAKGFKNVCSEKLNMGFSQKLFNVFGLRESIRRFSSFFTTGEKEKKIISSYDKRVVLPDFDTKPIELRLGE